jgi:AcrR family transcriptional regulator
VEWDRPKLALVPRDQLPREMDDRTRRERLLAAMVEVVSERGYADSSVPRVAARAGMSTRSFYRVFENRPDCFLAAYDEIVDRLVSLVGDAYGAESEPGAALSRGLAAFLDYFADRPEIARLCFLELPAVRPGGEVRRRQTIERVAELVARHLSRSPAGPGPSAEMMAEFAVGGVYNIVYERVRAGEIESLPRLAGQIEQALLAGGMRAAA